MAREDFILPTGSVADIACPQAVEFRLSEEFRKGMYTGDEGITWFDHSDPFCNVLCLMVSKYGDDWSGTVFFGGLPCLFVVAGGTRDRDSQFEASVPEYLEPGEQSVHALFFEWVVGSLPCEGDEDDVWPFPHDAANMVHERMTPEDCSKYLEHPPIGDTAPHYDLYHHLMGEAGGEGHEFVAFVGDVARSMCEALKDVDPAFAEGGEAHDALRGF